MKNLKKKIVKKSTALSAAENRRAGKRQKLLPREACAMALILALSLNHQPLSPVYDESLAQRGEQEVRVREAVEKVNAVLNATGSFNLASNSGLKDAIEALAKLDADSGENKIQDALTEFNKQIANFNKQFESIKDVNAKIKAELLIQNKDALANLKNLYTQIAEAHQKASDAIKNNSDNAIKSNADLSKLLKDSTKSALTGTAAILPGPIISRIPGFESYKKLADAARVDGKKASKAPASSTSSSSSTSTSTSTTSTGSSSTSTSTSSTGTGSSTSGSTITLATPVVPTLTAAEIDALNNLATKKVNDLKLSELEAIKTAFGRKAEIERYVNEVDTYNSSVASATPHGASIPGDITNGSGSTIRFPNLQTIAIKSDIKDVETRITELEKPIPAFRSTPTADQVDLLNGLAKLDVTALTTQQDVQKYLDLKTLITNMVNHKAAIDKFEWTLSGQTKPTGITYDTNKEITWDDIEKYNTSFTAKESDLTDKLAEISSQTLAILDLSSDSSGRDKLEKDEYEFLVAFKDSNEAALQTILKDKDVDTLKKYAVQLNSNLLQKVNEYKASINSYAGAEPKPDTITADGGTLAFDDIPDADLATTELGTARIKFSDALNAAIAVKTGLNVGTLTEQVVKEAITMIDSVKNGTGDAIDSKLLLAKDQAAIKPLVDFMVVVTDQKTVTDYLASFATYRDALGVPATKRLIKQTSGTTAEVDNLDLLGHLNNNARNLITAYNTYLAQRDALFDDFDLTFQDGATTYPVFVKADKAAIPKSDIENNIHIKGFYFKIAVNNVIPFILKGGDGAQGSTNKDRRKTDLLKALTEFEKILSGIEPVFKLQVTTPLDKTQLNEAIAKANMVTDDNLISDANVLKVLNDMAGVYDTANVTFAITETDKKALESLKTSADNQKTTIEGLKDKTPIFMAAGLLVSYAGLAGVDVETIGDEKKVGIDDIGILKSGEEVKFKNMVGAVDKYINQLGLKIVSLSSPPPPVVTPTVDLNKPASDVASELKAAATDQTKAQEVATSLATSASTEEGQKKVAESLGNLLAGPDKTAGENLIKGLTANILTASGSAATNEQAIIKETLKTLPVEQKTEVLKAAKDKFDEQKLAASSDSAKQIDMTNNYVDTFVTAQLDSVGETLNTVATSTGGGSSSASTIDFSEVSTGLTEICKMDVGSKDQIEEKLEKVNEKLEENIETLLTSNKDADLTGIISGLGQAAELAPTEEAKAAINKAVLGGCVKKAFANIAEDTGNIAIFDGMSLELAIDNIGDINRLCRNKDLLLEIMNDDLMTEYRISGSKDTALKTIKDNIKNYSKIFSTEQIKIIIETLEK